MLAVPADRLPAALADLDPGNRALLDLSLRRGVSDAEIGELLRKHPEDVSRGREAVLGLLADALDLDGHDRRDRVRRAIAELPDEAWRAAPAPDPPAPPPEERPEPPRAEADDEPEPEEREERPVVLPRDTDRDKPRRDDLFIGSAEPARRRRPGRLLALVGLLVVIGVLLALLLSGGDDDGDDPAPPRKLQEAFPRGEGQRATRLEPVSVTRGSGRIFVAGDGRLVVALRGLPKPAGTYQAWLYDSVVDAVPLGTFREGSGRLSARLPARAARYRFVDVSLEPADSNRNHSGDSVLRARLGELLER
jgi:hypothetical protein